MMEAEPNECMQLAEKKKDFNYVIKGNALKRKSKQKKSTYHFAKRDRRTWNEKEKNSLIYFW